MQEALTDLNLTAEVEDIMTKLEDGRKANGMSVKLATIALIASLILMVAWWAVGKTTETATLAGVTELTLRPVLVSRCELLGGEGYELITTTDIKRRSFESGFVYLTFEGDLPPSAEAMVELWVRDGRQFVIRQFTVSSADIEHETIYSAAIGITAIDDEVIDPDEWVIGATVNIRNGSSTKDLGEIVLAE